MSKHKRSFLSNALDKRYLQYRQMFHEAQLHLSEQTVHDLRVALRRLLTVLMLLKKLIPDIRLKKTIKQLKKQFDELNHLRDVQVSLLEVNQRIVDLPVLSNVKIFLEAKQDKYLRQVQTKMAVVDIVAIDKRIITVKKALMDVQHKKSIADLMLKVVHQRYCMVSKRKNHINLNQPDTVHQLRIAFKKFRYLVEIVHPILPRITNQTLKSMQTYQDRLGYAHDSDVLLGFVYQYAARHPRAKLKSVIDFYSQQFHDRLLACIDVKDAVDSLAMIVGD